MTSLIRDLRQAVRSLRRSPGLTAIAVVTLALGIGASTAIFSALDALWLRPLPIPGGDRLVAGLALREGFDPFLTSLLEYAEYRRAGSLEESGVATGRSFNLTQGGEPERVKGAAVMREYLATLGVRPAVGRLFSPEEDRPGGAEVALISHGLWRRRFGADPGIVGRGVDLEGRPRTIVGVLAPGFDMPYGAEIWMPLRLAPESLRLDQQAANSFDMVGRLKPGVSIERADAELKGLAARVAAQHPNLKRGWSYRVIPLRQQLMIDLDGRIRRSLGALAIAVGFLVLACCANVAGLLLVRGLSRVGQVAVRRALGASRWRVVRPALAEGFLIATAGGASGVLLALWALPALRALNPIHPLAFGAGLSDFRLSGSVLLFSAAATLVTGALAAGIPALQVARSADLAGALRRSAGHADGRAASRRPLSLLVTAEIAVAVTLLTGGALLIRSFQRLQQMELGFRPDRLLIAEMALTNPKHREFERRLAFAEEVLRRVRALPGVVGAGTTTNVPLQEGASIDTVYDVEGRPPSNPADVPIAALRLVSPGYLETLGVTLVEGRFPGEADRADALPVAVVSEEFARRSWPGETALGKRFQRRRPSGTESHWLTVVGIVRDAKEDRFNFRIDRPVAYLPYAQDAGFPPTVPIHLVVRTEPDPETLSAAVRRAIAAVDAEQPVSNLRTMTSHLGGMFTAERFGAVLMGTLAAIGVVLSALGLYGVMAHRVGRRTREIGLRMALGARPRQISRLVMAEGLGLLALGLAAGLAGAAVLARLFSGFLFAVAPGDPAVYAAVLLLVSAVAAAATWLPARRAARLDPTRALKAES